MEMVFDVVFDKKTELLNKNSTGLQLRLVKFGAAWGDQ